VDVQDSRYLARFSFVETATVSETVSRAEMEPLAIFEKKNLIKLIVWVTGSEPATYTSRRLLGR
jgi:hypothetical protein